jgi:hypothetical protein
VPVGKVHHLRVQIIPAEEVLPGGEVRERPRPHAHDVTLELQPPPPQGWPIRVSVSVAAENFEIQCARPSAEIAVPAAGRSHAVHFPLRGLAVGPGRVMLDFEQDGRPLGSVDLPRAVVPADQPEARQSGPAGGELALDLGRQAAAPDVVLKVFEHRLAGTPGRLQFVLSSCHPGLRDLPVLDGDLGTQDLRAEVAPWVEEQLRSLGELAPHEGCTPEEASRALSAIGHSLYEQLLPEPM